MISSRFTKLSLCVFLLASSFGQVAIAQADAVAAIVPVVGEVTIKVKKPCLETYLRQHKGQTLFLALVCAAAVHAKPTKGNHDLSEELFLNDTTTWFKNAFGWFGKDAKITSVDEDGVAIYKPGYEGRGLVGAAHELSKYLAPFVALTLLLKTLEPYCQMGNLFTDKISTKPLEMALPASV